MKFPKIMLLTLLALLTLVALFIVPSTALAQTDDTPPVITPNVSGSRGQNGWYVSNVTVSWSVSDAESTVSSTTGCETRGFPYINNGITPLTCEATSGGGANSASITIKMDTIDPIVEFSVSSSPNRYDWYNTDVTVSYNGYDGISGIAFCSPDDTLRAEGRYQSATGSCTDNAGNSGGNGTGFINID
ncbi:MAG: hypothetical protein KDE58_37150, partial [Caldilineaceae bacterium]|nr:hypothetical protein [Caldilineaceae bacterium]